MALMNAIALHHNDVLRIEAPLLKSLPRYYYIAAQHDNVEFMQILFDLGTSTILKDGNYPEMRNMSRRVCEWLARHGPRVDGAPVFSVGWIA